MTTTKKQRPSGPQSMTPAELRTIRQALGYSREDMACALGMPGQQAQVYRWETGRVSIRPVVAMSVRLIAAKIAAAEMPAKGESSRRKRCMITLCDARASGAALAIERYKKRGLITLS